MHETIRIPFPNGEHLHLDLHGVERTPGRAIVFVHGFGSRRDGEKSVALAEACSRGHHTYCCFDFRGHGDSGGTMRDLRPSRLLEDLSSLRDYLAERGILSLGLVGSSMGGFASAWFALQAPEVKACVLLAPAFRFMVRRWAMLSEFERRAWKEAGFVRWKNQWVDVEVGYGLVEERDRFPLEQLAANWTKPALIFHGLNDDTVPVDDSLEFLSKTTGQQIELRLFKNGDHRLSGYQQEIAAEAFRFLTASNFVSSERTSP